MNFRIFSSVAVVLTLLVTACSTDDNLLDTFEPIPMDGILVTSNITENTVWECDQVYILGGRISIESGASLTICPGTIIKGQGGTAANASSLVVARGAQLFAEGTVDAPIIFTSVADEITIEDVKAGDFVSPNLDPDINGLWGGLIVLGNATISASNANTENGYDEVQIEGIPTSDTNGLYGGNDDYDNSGILTYISIRHGGVNIGQGNEINGLTLGGVGSGTVIENIEIVANQDDGIEWFGGTVNVSNVVVWNVGDDAIDTDQAWAGTLDNFVIVTPSGSCFELDGPEGVYSASHSIQNGTVIAITPDRSAGGYLIDVDENTPVFLKNIHFTAPISKNGEFLMITNGEAANTTFENVTFSTEAENLSSILEQEGSVPAGISAGSITNTDSSVMNWTWASIAGGFNF
jgi:hypothetical protein